MKISVNWEESIEAEKREKKREESMGNYVKKKIHHILKTWNREVYSQVPSGSISITFCDDRFIRRINREYRNKDKATDVLSFNLGDNKNIMGDIYISVPTAKRQAKEYNVPLKDEILRLAIHGTFHVLGYTHKEMGIYGS